MVAQCLIAFRDGDDSTEAEAGAVILAEFVSRVIRFLSK